MINEKKINIIKNSKPFRLLDIIVFAVVATVVVLLIVFSFSNKGERVEIKYNGQSAYYYLGVDKEIDIDGKLTVIIKDNVCYVKNPTCPDHVCERTGAIKNVGRMIVCAPYGIVITILGDTGNKV